MSKLNHTPGPWENHYGLIVNERQAAPVICSMFGKDEQDFHNAPANARLIAAAPELKDVALEGYELSRYAACSKVENTEEFLTGLMERIELYQYNCKRVIESATGLPIEEVLK